MYKSKYTTVETQNASEGLSNGLDKAKERISNPEGMVKDISKIERQRKDQNKQTEDTRTVEQLQRATYMPLKQ